MYLHNEIGSEFSCLKHLSILCRVWVFVNYAHSGADCWEKLHPERCR